MRESSGVSNVALPEEELDVINDKMSEFFENDELSLIPDSLIVSDIDAKELSSEENDYTLSLRIKEFTSDKEMKYYIKSIISQVRHSPEYRVWTDYVREVLGHFNCVITGEMHAHTSVDIHHHPVALYSIVNAVVMQYLNSGKSFCSYDIATDVIELHYENRVGYISLVSSMHEKFHNGFLNIPMELVQGDWEYCAHSLEHTEDDLKVINERLLINKSNCSHSGWRKDEYPGIKKEE